jgi:hypothetical protein
MADLRSTRLSLYLRNYMLGTGAAIPQFAGGKVNIYSGAQPATPETAPSGVLLVTLTLGTPAFPAPVGGVLTANAIAPAMPVAAGVPGWVRITDAAGANVLVDGEAGLSSDANTDNLELPAAIQMGVQVGLSSLTITLPMQGV